MEEYPFRIKGAGINGLVSDPLYPPGADFASTMRNLRPSEAMPREPEWFTCPFSFTLDWPFPQLFRGENVTLLFGRTSISSVASNWALTSLTVKRANDRATNATLTGGGVWHFASFEESWFATNGVDFVFKTPAHAEVLCAQGLSVQTLCAHEDRLILAGLAGNWFSGSRWLGLFDRWRATQPRFSHDQMTWSVRWAVWSEPVGGASDIPFHPLLSMLGVFGDATFDALEAEYRKRVERAEMGFSSMRRLGTPAAMAQLGPDVVIYSTEGRVRLQGTAQGDYTIQKDAAPGVFNRGALSALDTQHAWVTPERELSAQAAGEPVRVLRQSHRLTGSLAGLAASCDPHEQEHWFTTENWSYVLTRWGLGGPMDVRPTSLCRAGGILVGPGSGLAAQTVAVEFYSHLTDIGYRGNKTIALIEVTQHGLSGLRTDVKAASGSEDPFSIGAVQANQYGVGYSRRAGNEFMVGALGTAPLGGKYGIPQLLVRYQSDDRRARRGTNAVAEDG